MHCFLVIKSNGEIWCTADVAGAKAISGTAVRLQLTPLMPTVKLGTISGTGPYTVSSNDPKDHNNRWAPSF